MPPDARIIQRRKMEDTWGGYQEKVNRDFAATAVAQWENTTHDRIGQLQVQREYQRLKGQQVAKLETRRDR